MTLRNRFAKLSRVMAVAFLLNALFTPFLAHEFNADAAGVQVSVSVPATASFNALTQTDVTFGWTSTAEYTAGSDTITISISPALAGAVANCATATTNIDGDASTDGSFGSFTTTGAVYTVSGNSTTTASTTGVDLCLRFANTTTTGTYSIAFSDTNGDFGAALVYVGDDNDVTVTANVAPTLSLNIRNTADSADTNTCAIGTVATTTTLPDTDSTVDAGASECGYGLAVGTNSVTGFQVQIDADAALNNVSANIANITNDAAFSSGVEAYGLANVTAAQTGRNGGTGNYDQTITENGNFAADTTPVPTSATNFVSFTNAIQYIAGSGSTDLTIVIHGLAVSTGTPAGSYDQLVEYTLTASF